MTRLDVIKRRYPSASTMRRLAHQIPDVTALDLEWLLARVEALVRAARQVLTLGCGCTLAGDEYATTNAAWQEMAAALTALEAPDA